MRKAPPQSATAYPAGTRRIGYDGRWWVVRARRWVAASADAATGKFLRLRLRVVTGEGEARMRTTPLPAWAMPEIRRRERSNWFRFEELLNEIPVRGGWLWGKKIPARLASAEVCTDKPAHVDLTYELDDDTDVDLEALKRIIDGALLDGWGEGTSQVAIARDLHLNLTTQGWKACVVTRV